MSTTPFHLTGKTILVTGASSGIGRQTALECAAMGASLIITGRNQERVNKLLNELPGSGHVSHLCDLLNSSAISSFVKDIHTVDGVVHCAGLVKPFPVSFLTREKLDETIHSNFYTVVELTTALFKAQKINRGASFIFLSSISGQHPHKGGSMYAASKAAVEAFCKTVALEYAHKGIRANCISPAMVKTQMFDDAVSGMSTQSMEEHVAKYPLGVGLPEDVARAAVFLLSPAARWITGTNMVMDGGLLLAY
jgi:NAD(P)-dependent dehydrogenase (short-subunit alcohol dehydrogenase family)